MNKSNKNKQNKKKGQRPVVKKNAKKVQKQYSQVATLPRNIYGGNVNNAKLLNTAINAIANQNQIKPVLESRKQWKTETKNDYFKSVMFPEGGRGSRIPSDFPIATATLHDVQRFDVWTNASGACSWVFYPTPKEVLAHEHRDVAFDPAVGPNLAGVGATSTHYKHTGFLTAGTPVCWQYRTVSTSCEYTNLQSSLNNQGCVTSCLLQTNLGGADYDASLNYVQKQLFSNIKKLSEGTSRIVYVPRDPQDIMLMSLANTTTLQSFIIFSFTGCAPSANIGAITFYGNYEFVPSKAFMGITPVATSQDKPSQIRKTVNTFDQQPQLVSATHTIAQNLASAATDLFSKDNLVKYGTSLIGAMMI